MSFTADFTRKTNWVPDSNAKIVRFAAGAPALETEFNEIQFIADKRLRELMSMFGDGLLDGGMMVYADGKLVIEDKKAIVGGNMIYISHLELELAPGEEAYLDVFEKEIGYKDVMRKYGNEQEVAITNYIVDSRYMKEISRRIIVAYDLVKTTGEDGHFYLKLGYVSANPEDPEIPGEQGEFVTEAATAGGAAQEAVEEVQQTVNSLSNQLSQSQEAQRVMGDTIAKQAAEIINLRNAIAAFSQIAAFDIKIPMEGWVKDEDMGDEDAIHIDIPIEGVNEGFVPLLTINPLSLKDAASCQMSSVTRTLDGYVRMYAKTVPTKEISTSLVLLGASNIIGGGNNT